jgi:hypothetical protein
VNCLAVYGNLVFTGSEDKDIKVITTKTTIFKGILALALSQESKKTPFLFHIFVLGVQVFQAVHCYSRLNSR